MSEAATQMTMQQYLAFFARRLFDGLARGIEDLTVEELNVRPHEHSNSIGFDAWHVFRTADNIIHFAFERERPVWLQQELNEAWSLPKVEQGTGMEAEVAHALRFPEAKLLAGYGRDVADAVIPRIEAMSDSYLQELTKINPWGEIRRLEAIGQTVISHGSTHLGQISLARTLMGKQGLEF